MTYDGPADIAVRREIRADFMTDSLVPLTIVRRIVDSAAEEARELGHEAAVLQSRPESAT